MFMQNIRRATRKHRKVLLAVVVLLMLGLVGTFGYSGRNAAPSASSGGEPIDSEDGQANDSTDMSLQEKIDATITYIETLKAGAADYSNYLSLAINYMALGDLYQSKYEADYGNLPEVPPRDYDEEGNVIPLEPEEETTQLAAEAAYEAAMTAAQAWLDKKQDALTQADAYYQLALDNVPEDMADVGIANVKYLQAQARVALGDKEGALTLAQEAYELFPDSLEYLDYLASLEEDLGNFEEALALYEKAAAKSPDDPYFITSQASVHGRMGDSEKAKKLFLDARAMVPEDIRTAYAYANFLFNDESPEAAKAEMEKYRDALAEGDPNIEQADGIIDYFQQLADIYASFNFSIDEDPDNEDDDHEHAEGEDDGNQSEETVDEVEEEVVEDPEDQL